MQITVAALFCTVVSFVVCAVFLNPTLSLDGAEAMPRWAAALACICLLFYQTLDNMDGKQARRIGLRSPLGLIVDHGCDALHAGVLGPATAAAVLGTGASSWQTAVIFMVGTAPFFTNSWESFHIGTFILPVVNGPSDGLCLIAACLGATAVYGPSAWRRPAPVWVADWVGSVPLPADVRAAASQLLRERTTLDLGMGFMIFMTFSTVAYQLTSVLLHEARQGLSVPAASAVEKSGCLPDEFHRQHAPRGGVYASYHRVLQAMTRLLPALLLAAAVFVTFDWSPSLLDRAPALTLACLGFAFADVTIRVMVAHVAAKEPCLVAGLGNALVAMSPAAFEWFMRNSHIGSTWLSPELVVAWTGVVTAVQLLKLRQFAMHVAKAIGGATGIPFWTVPPGLVHDAKSA